MPLKTLVNQNTRGKILILGGTSETFITAEKLMAANVDWVISVTTPYGYDLFSERYKTQVIQKKFNLSNLSIYIKENNISEIIDCTHPYAKEITDIAISTCKTIGITYTSRIRNIDIEDINYEKVRYADNFVKAVDIIKTLDVKRILFTTGSNNLAWVEDLKDQEVYVRVLPYEESIKKCIESGIKRQNIIAMQGPFSTELNSSILDQYNIDCLVTKRSGKEGGYDQKIKSVKSRNIWLIIIERVKDLI